MHKSLAIVIFSMVLIVSLHCSTNKGKGRDSVGKHPTVSGENGGPAGNAVQGSLSISEQCKSLGESWIFDAEERRCYKIEKSEIGRAHV